MNFRGHAILPWMLVALGCGGGAAESGARDSLAAGFVYVGARDDYGYNQAHAEGAQAVKKLEAFASMKKNASPTRPFRKRSRA